ncbi:UDP-N-acetylmuramoyl-L-alanine--D-glutamate ligase [Candidatus Kuenenbacteria bacterium]|nr:UDP-N-acetylmuramoyl-L-alanine--D-glutamate ligase [Candidatus Kuenenbacteria bacterium]
MTDQKFFKFLDYKFQPQSGVLVFKYALGNINFQEKLKFPARKIKLDKNKLVALDKAIFNLFLIAGISYYKTYCPKKIDLGKYKLTKEQANFWGLVYTKGLGEFFYRNKIDFCGLVNFPFEKNYQVKPIKVKTQNKTLVPIGGGKDSIVVAEMLKKKKRNFDLIYLGQSTLVDEVVGVIGRPLIRVERYLSPNLFALNKNKGVYNGHIPISVYYSLVDVVAAILYGHKEIVLGNEKSASYGNVEYLGMMINHQWSKSAEFEKMFQKYVFKFITPSIKYHSILRQKTELEIVGEFVKYKKYFPVFSSCNTNFKITKKAKKRWCGQCPKCAFVWTMLSAYLAESELEKIFGKNLYQDRKLKPIFDELLGLKRHKPFECVGTPEEMENAIKMADKLRNKKVLILGFGREGLSTLKFLLKNKLATPEGITIADQNKLGEFGPEYRNFIKKYPSISLKLGKDYLKGLAQFKTIFKTPGIKLAGKTTKELKTKNIEITSGLNLFLSSIKGKVVGVTGTKGKSTTASLIYEILKTAGKKTVLVGNIGKPFLDYINQDSKDTIFVAELSSYQLEILNKKIDLAVVTSFYPEHLNYHGSLDNYFQAKMNIVRQLKPGGVVVYNKNFKPVAEFIRKQKVRASTYSDLDRNFNAVSQLLGNHNEQNMAGAIAVAKIFGVKEEIIKKALKKFQPLEHRLEFVGKFKGINFYNDVLSTTPESTIEAIKALQSKNLQTLIVGGFDRGLDYKKLAAEIKKSKIRTVICWPHAGETIAGELAKTRAENKIIRVKNMAETVRTAYKYTELGETVALSPAASSYDFYNDYRAKGTEFKKLVKQYAKN